MKRNKNYTNQARISKKVFIIWNEYNRRPDVLAQALQCESLFLKHIINNRSFAWKYLFWIDYLNKTFRTLVFLIQRKPDIVLAQSPPSFCPMVCLVYCKIKNKILITDGHNNAFESPWISIPWYKKVLRKSKAVLVHNEELADLLKQKYKDINFFTLPDKIISLQSPNHKPIKKFGRYFFVVASFASDEPLAELFEGIKLFMADRKYDIEFIITGNYRRNIKLYNLYKKMHKITFLGYVDDTYYIDYLKNAFGVIALSKRPMVQQCAAIESLGVEVPLITSDYPTNRRIFRKGAILTKNNPRDIKNAINQYISKASRLKTEITQLKKYSQAEWEENFALFLSLIDKS